MPPVQRDAVGLYLDNVHKDSHTGAEVVVPYSSGLVILLTPTPFPVSNGFAIIALFVDKRQFVLALFFLLTLWHVSRGLLESTPYI